MRRWRWLVVAIGILIGIPVSWYIFQFIVSLVGWFAT
jgi:hypothetical protein